MAQLSLFNKGKPRPKPAQHKPWRRVAGWNGGSCGARYHYYGPDGAKDTGWSVQHCGHPTANFPYVIVTPTGEMLTANNGRAFVHLAAAKRNVEALANGLPADGLGI